MCEQCNTLLQKKQPDCRTSERRTGIGAALLAGCAVKQGDGDGTTPAAYSQSATLGYGKTVVPPTPPKTPASLSTVITVETPQKPKVHACSIGIGQAIRLYSGNIVYRLALDIYLIVSPYNVTLHYSANTLPDFAGELLPLGSKLIIRI